MVRAIMTKYIPATDYKGSRISATDGHGHRVTIGYRDDLSSEEAHKLAAVKLIDKMQWKRHRLVGGTWGDKYIFTLDDEE